MLRRVSHRFRLAYSRKKHSSAASAGIIHRNWNLVQNIFVEASAEANTNAAAIPLTNVRNGRAERSEAIFRADLEQYPRNIRDRRLVL